MPETFLICGVCKLDIYPEGNPLNDQLGILRATDVIFH